MRRDNRAQPNVVLEQKLNDLLTHCLPRLKRIVRRDATLLNAETEVLFCIEYEPKWNHLLDGIQKDWQQLLRTNKSETIFVGTIEKEKLVTSFNGHMPQNIKKSLEKTLTDGSIQIVVLSLDGVEVSSLNVTNP